MPRDRQYALIDVWVLHQVGTSTHGLMHKIDWEKGRGRRFCTHQRLIIDATSSHVEGIDSLQSHWYRGAGAGKTFVHFAYDSSGRNMRVSSYYTIRVSKA